MRSLIPQCRSCFALCNIHEAFVIDGIYINDIIDTQVYVCGSMCVTNYLESLDDFPEITTKEVKVTKVYDKDISD